MQRLIKCGDQIDGDYTKTAIQATPIIATANYLIEAIKWSAEMVVTGLKSSPCVDAINVYFDVMRRYFLRPFVGRKNSQIGKDFSKSKALALKSCGGHQGAARRAS